MKNLLILLFISSMTLKAMENIEMMRERLKELQAKRILNEKRDHPLPALAILMILSNPDLERAQGSPSMPAHARLGYTATPDNDGKYIIEENYRYSTNMTFVPRLTTVTLNPENPVAPTITYRIERAYFFEPRAPTPSDLTISVPYEIPRMLNVLEFKQKDDSLDDLQSIVEHEKLADKKFDLAIVIQKTTNPDIYEEELLLKALHDMALSKDEPEDS